MTCYTVTLTEIGESYVCGEGESLLAGMLRLGKKGIPIGCRGGGCGVCRIEVVSGLVRVKTMSREHVSHDDETAGRILACCAYPASDITLKVAGPMKKNVCRTHMPSPLPVSVSAA